MSTRSRHRSRCFPGRGGFALIATRYIPFDGINRYFQRMPESATESSSPP